MIVYLAAPLFTQKERNWNRALATALGKFLPGATVVMPQDFKTAGKYNDPRHYGSLFRMCVDGVDRADAVVAVLEGMDVDSGAAWEMGYAYARGKPIIGVRTDYRPGPEHGVNIMIARSCRYLVREYAFQEDIEPLAQAVARRLAKVRQRDKGNIS